MARGLINERPCRVMEQAVRLPRFGIGDREPLVPEVGDDLQPPARGLDIGGQDPQFGRRALACLIAETPPE